MNRPGIRVGLQRRLCRKLYRAGRRIFPRNTQDAQDSRPHER